MYVFSIFYHTLYHTNVLRAADAIARKILKERSNLSAHTHAHTWTLMVSI